MKKLYTTIEYKKRNTKISNDAIDNHQRRKNKGFNNRSKLKYLKSTTRFFNNSLYNPYTTQIQAPTNFSLVDNTEETLMFFNNAQRVLKNNKRVLLDISKIEVLTVDAIAILIAKAKDINFHSGEKLFGNSPKDKKLRKLFDQSGFYDYVNAIENKPINNNKLLIHKETNNKVEPEIAKKACLLGLGHTHKGEDIFGELYEVLIEIMQNTNNHAAPRRGKYNWWLHVYNHPNLKKTSYTFLDLGSGIFESLPVRSYKRDLLEFFGLTSNIDLVEKLFTGKIKSQTARPERGKGIPQVYDCSQDEKFEKFILISNDVYANLKTNTNKLMSSQFNGTLFYWEITNNN